MTGKHPFVRHTFNEFSTPPDEPSHPLSFRALFVVALPLNSVILHRGLPRFQTPSRRIVTTGTFDGVHLGHQALLQWMVHKAKEEQGESIVLTFDPHPRKVLFGTDSGLSLLQTMDQRAESLAKTGLDHLVIQPFDRAFSRLKPLDFVRDVLHEGLGCTTVVVGHDHRFGAGREGDEALLRECADAYGFDVAHIPPHIENELTVSSTKIRQRLSSGEVEEAAQLLGKPFEWMGTVVHGEARGRTLGFPTANLRALETDQMLPATGVYAAMAVIEGGASLDPAMVHIGPRPTFDAEGAPSQVEAHLLRTDAPDLYGKKIGLQFAAKLRDVQRFTDREALIAQLHRDASDAEDALQQRNPPPSR